MSTYYVSGANGDDAKDGLSESNAWATVTKAVQTLVAGDKCHIAPYTYRNTSGWSLTNAGSSGSIIEYIGDPDCEHFSDENPGYIRLTGCDAAELPSCATKIFDYNSKDYVTLKNVVVDGAENGSVHGVYMGTGNERKAENCIAFGSYYVFYVGIEENCIAVGGRIGFYVATAKECISFGAEVAFQNGTSENCIAIGSKSGYYLGTQNNCMAVGSNYGFHTGNQNNCLAVGGYYEFYKGTQNKCVGIGGYYGFYQGALTSCKGVYCYILSSGTSGDAATAANHIGFTNLRMLKNLARWLKPDLFFEKDGGDDSIIPAVTEDILGQPRRMHDGTIDVGVFEYSDVEIDWTNYQATAPGIKITRKGVQEFDLPAKKAEAVTVKVWVKFDVSGDKPQLILQGDAISTQTDTATGDGSSWEQLEVTATPTYNGVLTVRLYQRDTTSAKYAIFSDLEVS